MNFCMQTKALQGMRLQLYLIIGSLVAVSSRDFSFSLPQKKILGAKVKYSLYDSLTFTCFGDDCLAANKKVRVELKAGMQ